MTAGDLTTLDHVKAWLDLSGLVVASVTKASPAVVTLATKPNTPLVSGLDYTIAGAVGMTEINGTFPITVASPLSFSIPVDTSAASDYVASTAYIGIADPVLQRLVTSCSAFIQNRINRRIAAQAYTETRDGTGGQVLVMAQYPVNSVASVLVDGLAMPPRPALNGASLTAPGFWGNPGGYTFDSVSVQLTGWQFPRGFQNVVVTYNAGFGVFGEGQTIPASAPYTLDPMSSASFGDLGVEYVDGTAFVKVSASPAQGQYTYSDGVWSFNAADAGAPVLLSYAITPYDIEQAAIDMVGDWFKYRSRIGQKSVGIEGQTTTFVDVPVPSRAAGVLENYMKRQPVTV